jgi:hypothetical protein
VADLEGVIEDANVVLYPIFLDLSGAAVRGRRGAARSPAGRRASSLQARARWW